MISLLRRCIVLTCVAVALSACTTVTRSLSLQDVRSFRLVAVEARPAPDAQINWGGGEQAYFASKGADPNDPATGNLAQTPEGRAAIGRMASDRLAGHLRAALAPQLTGTRPVKVILTLRAVIVPSAIFRVVVGGNPTMTGDVVVVDAATGKTLLTYDSLAVQAVAGQGVGGALIDATISGGQDHIDRVGARFGATFVNWLMAE
jgi:hypothetical protein